MMNTNFEVIKNSWDEEGFVGQLREGIFDSRAYNILCESLQKMQAINLDAFDKEFVSYIWFIPIYMGRQKEYVANISHEKFEECKENIEELILGIFGYPGQETD